VVLDVRNHALVGGVIARALGNCLTEHDAVQLEAKVVVQPGRPVLLDDELQALGFGLAALAPARA